MKIVATIEVQLPDIDEENASHHRALMQLMSNPQEMVEYIYKAIELDGFGIHSPHIEEGEI